MGMTRKDFELIAWAINKAGDKAIKEDYCAEGTRDTIIELLEECILSQHPRFDTRIFRNKTGYQKESRAPHLVDVELPL